MISSFGVDVGFASVGKIKFICNSCFPEIPDPMYQNSGLDLENIRIASMCFQSSLQFLDSCEPNQKSTLTEVQYALLAASERLVASLADKFYQWDTIKNTRKWFSTCEESVYALYRLHPYPEEIISRLILNLFVSWKNSSISNSSTVTTCRLARFLFLLGQSLLGLLLYTEKMATFSKSMKDKHAKSAQSQDKKTKSSKSKKKSEEEDSKAYQENDDVDAMEEEMGMVAAVDADHEKV